MFPSDKQVASFLSEEHARLLEWYFGVGRSTFGRSTCGPIIERLQMFAFGSEPCKDCNGTGFRGGWSYGDDAERTRGEELAALLAVPQKPGQDPDARCERCKGSGVSARTSARRAREPITARPKVAKAEGAGYTPTDYALQHYAIACRRLDLVHAVDPKAVAVLEAFYGDWGGRWADTKQGRLFAIYPMTNAGRKLVRMSTEKAQSHVELRPDETLGVEFELQRTQPNKQRADMFEAAREQAKRLLAGAERVWNDEEPERESEKRAARRDKRKAQRDARIVELVGILSKCESEAIRHDVAALIEAHAARLEPTPAAAAELAEAS